MTITPFNPNKDAPFGPGARLRSFDVTDHAKKLTKNFFEKVLKECETSPPISDASLECKKIVNSKLAELRDILTKTFIDPEDKMTLEQLLITQKNLLFTELEPKLYEILKSKKTPQPPKGFKFWKKV